MDTPELSIRELDALFEQSPVAMVFSDPELRTRRANAAFRQLTGIPQEAFIGHRPSQTEGAGRLIDTHLIERTLAEQVINEGVPVADMRLERPLPGGGRVFSWTAYRVTDNGRVLGAVSSLIDITGAVSADRERRQANARLDLLQRAGSEIGTTLDVYRTAEELATLAVPGLADRVAVEVLDQVMRGEDPASADLSELRFRRLAVLDSATAGAGNFAVDDLFIVPITCQPAGVFLRGELLVARSPAEMGQLGLPPAIVQPLLDRGVHTLITVPLTARGVTLGVATFSRSTTPHPYDEADVRLVCDLAARAAVHIDNARLYTREHDAAVTLQRTNVRLDLLQRAGSEIGTTLDIQRTAEELAALVVPDLADRVTVDLLDLVLRDEDPASADTGELRFRRVAFRDAGTADTANLTAGGLWTMEVTRRPAVAYLRGEPLLARSAAEIRQLDLAPILVRLLLDRGVHAFLAVPLTSRGVTLGVAGFGRAESPEPYGEADVRLLGDLAARAAVHIDNARLYTREHGAAVTLQRSLLPRDVPQVPGLDIAYRYQPASRASAIGGDWFDVIPLDGGRVSLVVGDVTGHGVRASAVMGQLRTTTATLARLGCPPDQIMRHLSDVVAAHGDEAGATCLHAVYDPTSRRCRLTSAGHPPPALRHPGGRTEYISLPPGLLLGAGSDPYPAIDKHLTAGSILALYTDGLIEQPGEDLAIGMSRLARALAAGPTEPLDDLCDSVLATLAPRPRDDIALLLARTTTGFPGD
jgi:PAS domain S-box-containing protein